MGTDVIALHGEVLFKVFFYSYISRAETKTSAPINTLIRSPIVLLAFLKMNMFGCYLIFSIFSCKVLSIALL